MTQLEVPVECMWWAVEQPPELVVLDDMAVVDLDWWNSRCAQREIPVHITGCDADGVVVDSGRVFVRRGDLVPPATGLAETPLDRLSRLYLCAAWLFGHPDRGRVTRTRPRLVAPVRSAHAVDSSRGCTLPDCDPSSRCKSR